MPGDRRSPPISGVGISLFGAQGVKVTGNHIAGNVPSGPTIFSGGVVLVRGFGGTAPRDNSVVSNDFGRDDPDIFWDGSGSGNRFRRELRHERPWAISVARSLCAGSLQPGRLWLSRLTAGG